MARQLVRLSALVATTGTFLLATGMAWGQAPERAITQIAGDLYRFQNGGHYSVFLVTPEGAIATDPISADAAAWLQEEIEERASTSRSDTGGEV